MNENLERCQRFVFAHVNDRCAARVPPAAVKPAAFTCERRVNALRANNAPSRTHAALRIHAVLDSPEQVLDFSRPHFGAGVIQRDGAAQTSLRKFQPLPPAPHVAKDFSFLLRQSTTPLDPIRFLLLTPPFGL